MYGFMGKFIYLGSGIFLIGNTYAQETLFGRYDASIGTLLLGNGDLNWDIQEPVLNNFVVDGDAKFIRMLKTANGRVLMIANNNAAIDFYRLQPLK